MRRRSGGRCATKPCRGSGNCALCARAARQRSQQSAIALARRQLQAARVAGFVQLEAQDARRISKPAQYESGLVIANLPYGERMGEERELMPLHREFGARLQAEFVGWRFALLAGTEALARATELRAEKPQKVYNGTLECLLITGSVAAPRAGIEGPLR
jgi:23S rRNA (guanine2445-N2)-methyltransferase / 23S rRNA (guanine2069-N7)-methyltransferase